MQRAFWCAVWLEALDLPLTYVIKHGISWYVWRRCDNRGFVQFESEVPVGRAVVAWCALVRQRTVLDGTARVAVVAHVLIVVEAIHCVVCGRWRCCLQLLLICDCPHPVPVRPALSAPCWRRVDGRIGPRRAAAAGWALQLGVRAVSEGVMVARIVSLEIVYGQANAWSSRLSECLHSGAAMQRFLQPPFVARILYHAPFKVVVGVLRAQVLRVLRILHGGIAPRGDVGVARRDT
jgi:hypothetical protein